MSWFRSKLQIGALLAFFALALQLVVSFGHVHRGVPLSEGVLLSAAGVSFDAQPASVHFYLVGQKSSDASSVPASDEPEGQSHVCSVCVVMALSSVAAHHAAPTVLLPDAVEFRFDLNSGSYTYRDLRRPAFQPRGPPAA